MLKSLPIILFVYSQKLCPLFFSKLPIVLKLFSISKSLPWHENHNAHGRAQWGNGSSYSKFNRDAILHHMMYYDVILQKLVPIILKLSFCYLLLFQHNLHCQWSIHNPAWIVILYISYSIRPSDLSLIILSWRVAWGYAGTHVISRYRELLIPNQSMYIYYSVWICMLVEDWVSKTAVCC